MPPTLLCIATYRKGDEFLRECRRRGCRVLLLTDEKLARIPTGRARRSTTCSYVRRDMPDDDIRKGAAYLARTERLDHIVALDDFDVEMAAMLREYLNVPGMGRPPRAASATSWRCGPGRAPRASRVPTSSTRCNHPTIAEWTAAHPRRPGC